MQRKTESQRLKDRGQLRKRVFHLVADFELLHFKWLNGVVSSKT